MLPLIPPHILSAIAIIGGILCVLVIHKLPNMTRSSMLQMYRTGLVLLAGAMLTFGGLYFYIWTFEPVEQVRQILVRWILLYLFTSIIVWQVILLKWGKSL